MERLQDLFLELATDADQLEFTVLFAIGRTPSANTYVDPSSDAGSKVNSVAASSTRAIIMMGCLWSGISR